MTIVDRLHSGYTQLSFVIESAFNATTQKIKEIATSPVAVRQLIIGAGLGAGMHKVYTPLTERILKALGTSPILSCPLDGGGLAYKILIFPYMCILAPILEEQMFRGDIQETLKTKFQPFFARFGFSDSAANISARVMSVFFGSVIFGIYHFSNAIFFRCNPILFLPQVVACIIVGLKFGLAKEFSGGLLMPIGMHFGVNTLAWVRGKL
jgi:membrane protease YdiL (CAAX protease family)